MHLDAKAAQHEIRSDQEAAWHMMQHGAWLKGLVSLAAAPTSAASPRALLLCSNADGCQLVPIHPHAGQAWHPLRL